MKKFLDNTDFNQDLIAANSLDENHILDEIEIAFSFVKQNVLYVVEFAIIHIKLS